MKYPASVYKDFIVQCGGLKYHLTDHDIEIPLMSIAKYHTALNTTFA